MDFDLDIFVRNPTLKHLDKYRKVDLVLVANVFDVQVPLNAKNSS